MSSAIASTSKAEHISSLAFLYEQEGIRLLQSRQVDRIEYSRQAQLNFVEAFVYLSQIAEGVEAKSGARFPTQALEEFRGGLPERLARTDLLLAFRLCASSVLANLASNIRREAERFRNIQAESGIDFVLRSYVALASGAPDSEIEAIERAYRAHVHRSGHSPENTGLDHLLKIASLASVQAHRISGIGSDRIELEMLLAYKAANEAFAKSRYSEILLHLADLAWLLARRISDQSPVSH